jgi:hypothetical protein
MPQSLEDFAPATKDVALKKRKKGKRWRSEAPAPAWREMKRKLKERSSDGR